MTVLQCIPVLVVGNVLGGLVRNNNEGDATGTGDPCVSLNLEAEITPTISPAEASQLASLAEQAGFDRLGISDVPFYHDTFVIQALCAAATKSIKIGSLVTNPYTWNPIVLASSVTTLHEACNGRAFLGIGAGAGLDNLGVDQSRPASALREALTVIRGLLQDKTVNFNGKFYNVTKAKLEIPKKDTTTALRSPIPILIGARLSTGLGRV